MANAPRVRRNKVLKVGRCVSRPRVLRWSKPFICAANVQHFNCGRGSRAFAGRTKAIISKCVGPVAFIERPALLGGRFQQFFVSAKWGGSKFGHRAHNLPLQAEPSPFAFELPCYVDISTAAPKHPGLDRMSRLCRARDRGR